jgi:hypothetical protein
VTDLSSGDLVEQVCKRYQRKGMQTSGSIDWGAMLERPCARRMLLHSLVDPTRISD